MGPMGAGLGGAISAASGLYSYRDALQAQINTSPYRQDEQSASLTDREFVRRAKLVDKLQLEKAKQESKKGKFMDHLRDYFKNNRDLIFNIGLIILVDHFVFKGAFREKIKNMVSTFCDKTHKMLEDTNHGKS